MMRTANPALSDTIFSNARQHATAASGTMTIAGTVNKTGALLLLTVLAASWSWSVAYQPGLFAGEAVFVPTPFLWGGAIAGLVLAVATVWKKTWSPITAPLYGVAEGLFLGALSAGFEVRYPGIVIQAVLGTFGTLFALLMAYRSGMIRATENFKLGVAAATGGIFLVYMLSMILGFFGINIPFIHDSGPIGIGVSLFVVVVASLNLVLDFDFIENGETMGATNYMEWYAAFGLLVTLIWLYIELLRLLAKLRDR